MSNSPDLLPLIGSVSAAIIAGAIAYIVSVLSKEQKTSEFRQAWIDGLRSDLAEFVAYASILSFEATARRAREPDPDAQLKFLYDKHDNLVKLHVCHRRILLRLNTKKHQALIKAVDDLANLQPMKTNDKEISDHSDSVILQSQLVLKTEWERVKKGESVFRWTKRVALSTMSLAILFAFYLTLCR